MYFLYNGNKNCMHLTMFHFQIVIQTRTGPFRCSVRKEIGSSLRQVAYLATVLDLIDYFFSTGCKENQQSTENILPYNNDIKITSVQWDDRKLKYVDVVSDFKVFEMVFRTSSGPDIMAQPLFLVSINALRNYLLNTHRTENRCNYFLSNRAKTFDKYCIYSLMVGFKTIDSNFVTGTKISVA